MRSGKTSFPDKLINIIHTNPHPAARFSLWKSACGMYAFFPTYPHFKRYPQFYRVCPAPREAGNLSSHCPFQTGLPLCYYDIPLTVQTLPVHTSDFGGTKVFTIYNDSGSDSTMVSNLFIDEYMKSANDAQIKVYLYLLRMMGAHRAASVSEMADQFNHTEKDVVRSLRYWERKGLLNLDFDGRNKLISIHLCRPGTVPVMTSDSSRTSDAGRVLSFSQPSGNLLSVSEEEDPHLQMAAGGEYPSNASLSLGSQPLSSSAPSELEALESFRGNADRAQLLFVIEQYIGKPLSLNEIRIIYHISEKLHFSDELIDYLLQYCVDRGKKDFRYIKKVAENWAESGILTPLQAEQAAAAAADETASPALRSEEKKPARGGRKKRTSNSFNQFEQNDYDFDALEKELLES